MTYQLCDHCRLSVTLPSSSSVPNQSLYCYSIAKRQITCHPSTARAETRQPGNTVLTPQVTSHQLTDHNQSKPQCHPNHSNHLAPPPSPRKPPNPNPPPPPANPPPKPPPQRAPQHPALPHSPGPCPHQARAPATKKWKMHPWTKSRSPRM